MAMLTDSLQKVYTTLEILDLRNNDIHDAEVTLLAYALSDVHQTLKVVNISGNIVGDEGATSLAKVLKNNITSY